MAKRTWQIQINGQSHTVRAQHSYWTGQRTVWLDERVVVSDRKLLEYGTRHTFNVDGQPATFEIVTNGFVYRYLLWVGDEPQTALEDGDRVGTLQSKVIRNRLTYGEYWRKLAELTGLKPFLRNDQPGLWQYRLIGRINQYVTMIVYGQHEQTLRPIIGILIRFRSGLDKAATQEAIRQDSDLQFFSDKTHKRRGFTYTIGDDYAWFIVPYEPKKETAEAVAARAIQLVKVISKYAQPLTECEGRTCKVKNGEPVQLVLINGTPTWLCHSCLEQLPEMTSDAQRRYQAAPSGLKRGILVGLGIAILGALAWAALAVVFQAAAAVIGMATFVGIVKAMDRVRTKRTITSLLIASGLAIVSAVLGVYLTAIWEVLSDPSINLSLLPISQFIAEMQHFVAINGRLLSLTLVYCLFGVLPYAFFTWWEQKRALTHAFQPRVEVVNFSL